MTCSRTDRSDPSPSSAGTRGQLEPTAALVATVAVCLSIGLYTVPFGTAVHPADRDLADPTLDRVEAELTVGGIAVPARRDSARTAGPSGYVTNLTLVAADRQWVAGPPVPRDADRTQRKTSVRVGADRVRAGTLRVAVWT